MSLRARLDELDYPLDYPFKVVFQARPDLVAEVESVLRQTLDAERRWQLTEQPSRTGKYRSLTIRLQVRSADETEHLHRTLGALPGVVVCL